MAEAATPGIAKDASSAIPQTSQGSSETSLATRRSRVTSFLKPESPRKRRRASGDSSQISAKESTLVTTSPEPLSPKHSVSPPTLTAAQALLDQRKQKQLQEISSDRQTSPNSARVALLALQGKQMISDKGSEHVSNAVNNASGSISAATPTVQKLDAPHVGVAQMQQSSTPSSSFGLVEEAPAAGVMESSGGPVASPGRMEDSMISEEDPRSNPDLQRPRRQETDPGESRADKALTYPGPLPNFPQADRRRNTHSGFGRDSESKSPSSTKKHQGDALARHSKGAGGCAGRRSSLGGDEQDQDETMHGLMYTGEASHEPDRMDDDAEVGDSRKGSLPSIKRHDAPNHSSPDGHVSYAARQPSTYPPIAGRQPNPGGLYPPIASPSAGSNTSNSPRQASFNQISSSSTFQAPDQNVFAPGGGMTESPKPLSPGSHQLGHPDSGINRNRSPSLTQQYQQQQYGRRTSTRNSPPPLGLPPMPPSSHPGAPHLPSLPGLPPPDLRFTLHSQAGAPSHMHANPHGSGGSVSSPGFPPQSGNNSLSSQSGDGSQNPYNQGNDRLWAYIRSLEVKIDRLQEEVVSLKGQLSAPR
ncbi:MAG: hypothetical protein Q9216_001699 [Gyalolechia sp. 2 TL-2023]